MALLAVDSKIQNSFLSAEKKFLFHIMQLGGFLNTFSQNSLAWSFRYDLFHLGYIIVLMLTARRKHYGTIIFTF